MLSLHVMLFLYVMLSLHVMLSHVLGTSHASVAMYDPACAAASTFSAIGLDCTSKFTGVAVVC
jgi:hypothetical protein